LPDGSLIDHEFSDEEWSEFRACARRHCARPDAFGKEVAAKLAERGLAEVSVERSVTARAKLVSYYHDGDQAMGRVGLWSPEQCVFVVASAVTGLILTAFAMDEGSLMRYVRAEQMGGLTWLRR
jgi:hypothetical protein